MPASLPEKQEPLIHGADNKNHHKDPNLEVFIDNRDTFRPPEGILSKKKAIYALILASAGLFTAVILRNKDATPEEPHGPYGSFGSYRLTNSYNHFGTHTGILNKKAHAHLRTKTKNTPEYSYRST